MEQTDLGKLGETLAEKLLTDKGYEIIRKNFRAGKGEIDLIAWSPPNAMGKKVLVFVEVKTRSEDFFGKPEAAVGWKKQQIVADTAGLFMDQIHYDWAIRFDVISILYKNNKLKSIEHLEDAFFPIR